MPAPAAVLRVESECSSRRDSSDHGCALLSRILELLASEGAQDILIFGGGIIPDQDIPALKAAGVKEIFQPGTHTGAIVQFLRDQVALEGSEQSEHSL